MSEKDNKRNYIERALQGKLSREERLNIMESRGYEYYYTPEQEFDDINKKMVIQEIADYIKPGRILELGYVNDIWTRVLLERVGEAGEVDIIEAASNRVKRAKSNFSNEPRIKVIQTLFEEYKPEKQYDTIMMSGAIKHIPNDIDFLRMAKAWLKPDGVVIASTPNSRSFHRRLGTYMGLELKPDVHNKRDIEVFDVHLYDRFKWRAIFIEAGYEVVKMKGIFLKILSTEQMMYLGQKYDILKIMEGLRQLGEELQDYAWFLMLIARLPLSLK